MNMGAFGENFPYTNFHDLNLDWIIKRMMELSDKVDNALKGYITVADPIQWDITKQYPAFTVVMDNGTAYMSTSAVPSGISITNPDYWQPIFDMSDIYANLKDAICFYDDGNSITSSRDREPDEYVWLGEKLFKVIAPIQQGDLYSNLNVEQVALSDDVLADIRKLNKLLKDIFPVSKNGLYTTIESAYRACVANHGGTVLIYPGEYDESFSMSPNSDQYDIRFVGISREKSIWKSTSFGYDKACFTGSGNLTFENLTMLKGTAPTTQLGGYALHMDYPDTEGNMYVRNCNLISYENAGLGCGTRTNQKIFVEDSTLIDYSQGVGHGGLLYHTAPEGGHTGQGISLINNLILGLGSGLPACSIFNSANNTEDVYPTFINNILFGDVYNSSQAPNYWDAIVSDSFVTANASIILSRGKCYGNSHNKLNFGKDEIYNQQTKQANGLPLICTDTLNPPIDNGYIQIDAGGTTDHPAGGTTFYGIVCTYANGYRFYIVMNATSGAFYFKTIQNNTVLRNWKTMRFDTIVAQYHNSYPLWVEKQMGAVYIYMEDMQVSTITNIIPSDWYPTHDITGTGILWNTNNNEMYPCRLILKNDGTLVIKRNGFIDPDPSWYLTCQLIYPIDD